MAKKIINGKVLITGGAGFLGTHIQDGLLKAGYKCFVLDNLSGGYKRNVSEYSKLFRGDVRSHAMVDEAMAQIKPDVVYHLAADAAEGRSQFTPISATENNIQGSVNVFTSAIRHGVRRIIFTSSIAVYGDQKPPFTEMMTPKPIDVYGVNKAATEEILKILCDVHKTEYVIFRPYNIIGERQNMADPYRNVSAIFMNRILRGLPPLIYGDGEQQRAFSYVKNIVNIMVNAIKSKPGGLYNIGPDKPVTVNKLARMILRAMDSDLTPEHLPERPHEVKLAYCDTSRVREEMGYKDIYGLGDGLGIMARWAKELGPQEPKYLDELELPNNAPEAWTERKI